MKLAEALQERADVNRRIAQLRVRIENNCLVQEGEKSAEDPEELIRQLDLETDRLQQLMAQINLTNCTAKVDGKTLTQIIAEKDALTLQLSAYRDIIDTASRIAQRATRSEIRILPAVDVKKMQSKADQLSKELRVLDNRLQETNWKTELIEA